MVQFTKWDHTLTIMHSTPSTRVLDRCTATHHPQLQYYAVGSDGQPFQQFVMHVHPCEPPSVEGRHSSFMHPLTLPLTHWLTLVGGWWLLSGNGSVPGQDTHPSCTRQPSPWWLHWPLQRLPKGLFSAKQINHGRLETNPECMLMLTTLTDKVSSCVWCPECRLCVARVVQHSAHGHPTFNW